MGVVEIRTEADIEQEVVGYERDIRPLFRDKDRVRCPWAFVLASYDDVRTNTDGILTRLSNGSMPCDGAWPEEKVGLFRNWVDGGYPA